jgi:hypothetical protein
MTKITRAVAAVKLLTRIRKESPALWAWIADFAKASSQPTPFTKEASAWHNEALARARKKLGEGADLSAVLQEAARIQQAGKCERTMA